MDRDAAPRSCPGLEGGRIARVRDDVQPADVRRLLDLVDDPIEDRPPTDGQQRFRDRVGERPQAGRVARGENEGLDLVPLQVMLPSFWVAPHDRGPEAGVYCLKGH
jgi:hypothetical protein